MDIQDFTNSTGAVIQRNGSVLIKRTEDQGERSHCYDLSYSKTGTGVLSITPKGTKKSPILTQTEQIAVSEEINRLLRKVSEIVKELVVTEDIIEQTNLVFTFKNYLEDLWKNRKHKEDNWGDLLNILQAVLAQEEFELLSTSQKLSIKNVVIDYLCQPNVDDTDIEKALKILSQGGFDPWVGISGIPQE
jgi:hypothetical protein